MGTTVEQTANQRLVFGPDDVKHVLLQAGVGEKQR